MKSGLKGGNAIVRLLLAHGEKIGIAAILICAGMLIWSALNVPTLDANKTPEELGRLAGQAENHVNSFKWQEISAQDIPEAPIVKSEPFQVNAMQQVNKEHWPLISAPNPHVIPPQKLRTDPLLLSAMELEVHADSGMWATANPDDISRRKKEALAAQQKAEREQREREARQSEEDDRDGGGRGRRGRDDERGDEEERPRGANATVVVQPRQGVELEGFETIEAKSWITVLARIPIKDQNNLYEDALKTARGFNPNTDMPQYLGYIVERAEITHEGQGKWERIAQVNNVTLTKELESYPVFPPEVVASRFVHPVMTHPLPPLILKEWDDRVKHSSMSLAVDDVPPMDEVLEEPAEAEAAEGEAEDDGGFGVSRPPADAGGMYGERGGYGGEMDGGRGGGGYGRGGYEMDGGGRGGYEMDGGRGGGGYGRGGGYGEMDGGGGYGRGQMGTGRGVELASFSWDNKTSDILLRFFDNSVEPGHRYRYRVKLAVLDVNDGVQVQYLDKTVTERRDALANAKLRTFRLTEWSEESPIASVPLPVRLYLVAAEPAKPVAGSSPEAEILIKALDSKFAAEIARQEKVTRGTVLNVREKAEVVWSNNYDVEQDPEFDFRTGTTLVDVQGGEKIGKKNRDLVAPGRAVLMDAAGKLSIQHELKDAPVVKDFNATKEMDQEGGGGGRGGFEMDGGRGGGRGGRGGGRGGRG
jgi:uncharacterized membrane protein YgcG